MSGRFIRFGVVADATTSGGARAYFMSKNDTLYHWEWEENCNITMLKAGRMAQQNPEENTILEVAEQKYYLYPNPTNEGTGAMIELPQGASGYIELWSMEGKQAGRHEIKGGKNQINLKGLGNGMYYYRVWIDNSINNTQKLILIN